MMPILNVLILSIMLFFTPLVVANDENESDSKSILQRETSLNSCEHYFSRDSNDNGKSGVDVFESDYRNLVRGTVIDFWQYESSFKNEHPSRLNSDIFGSAISAGRMELGRFGGKIRWFEERQSELADIESLEAEEKGFYIGRGGEDSISKFFGLRQDLDYSNDSRSLIYALPDIAELNGAIQRYNRTAKNVGALPILFRFAELKKSSNETKRKLNDSDMLSDPHQYGIEISILEDASDGPLILIEVPPTVKAWMFAMRKMASLIMLPNLYLQNAIEQYLTILDGVRLFNKKMVEKEFSKSMNQREYYLRKWLYDHKGDNLKLRRVKETFKMSGMDLMESWAQDQLRFLDALLATGRQLSLRYNSYPVDGRSRSNIDEVWANFGHSAIDDLFEKVPLEKQFGQFGASQLNLKKDIVERPDGKIYLKNWKIGSGPPILQRKSRTDDLCRAVWCIETGEVTNPFVLFVWDYYKTVKANLGRGSKRPQSSSVDDGPIQLEKFRSAVEIRVKELIRVIKIIEFEDGKPSGIVQ